MKVGFIGLGLMGIRMANNLIEHGHELVIYNRTIEKADQLIKKGAVLVQSPLEVGKQVNIN